MIYVHVKHYLNDEGMQHFDDWFSRVKDFMSKSKGYRSLESEKFADKNMVHIVLEFNSEPELNAWVKQKVHDDLVNALDQYRTVDHWHAARTEDPSADWKTLSYEKIKATQ